MSWDDRNQILELVEPLASRTSVDAAARERRGEPARQRLGKPDWVRVREPVNRRWRRGSTRRLGSATSDAVRGRVR